MRVRDLQLLRIWMWASVFTVLVALWAQAPPVIAEPTSPQSQSPNLRSLSVTLGSKAILAKVADNDSSRTQGLLGWTTINEETGMLLEFPFESDYAIHMQGMKFPIDAIWIDSKGVIRLIYEDIQANSGQVYPSMFPCRYCLEVKAGFCKKFGVKIGQTVNFGGGNDK